MSIALRADRYRGFVTFGLVAVSSVVLWGCGGGGDGGSSQPQAIPLTVPKATRCYAAIWRWLIPLVTTVGIPVSNANGRINGLNASLFE